MKTKLITQEPTFRPITIELTIESWEELEEWYARCNASYGSIQPASYLGERLDWETNASRGMYRILKKILENK